ncbi:hypothetical protein ES159_16745 [Klebsiella aerogenes]|nr:hypothetical protein ES159_16745 [Klebsiella aerogenes]RSV94830.1 hypothetical protein EGH55_07420 [Klebsiella aerogenes]
MAFLIVIAQERTIPICSISVEVKSRWRLTLYLKSPTLFCQIIQRESDNEKASAFIMKYGISQRVKVSCSQYSIQPSDSNICFLTA